VATRGLRAELQAGRLADLLDQALDERLPAGRTWRDQSYGWRRTLDGGREHDREQALTSGLRDAAVLLARSDPPGVATVVETVLVDGLSSATAS
jgi:hypothetical protein